MGADDLGNKYYERPTDGYGRHRCVALWQHAVRALPGDRGFRAPGGWCMQIWTGQTATSQHRFHQSGTVLPSPACLLSVLAGTQA